MRNRDPRLLLLLFLLVPFVLWIDGALLVWQCWKQPLGATLTGVVVVLSGFAIVRQQDLIITWIYRTHLRGAVVDSVPNQWVPVEMERTGTQDKLHVLPDTVGILQKSTDGLVLRELRGMEVHLARTQFITTNVSKTNMTCSILFADHHNNDLIGSVVTPRCIGASMEVATDGNSRYQWFLQWAGITTAPPPRKDNVQAEQGGSTEPGGSASVSNQASSAPGR